MGAYERVRSDDALALAVDLEAGAPRHDDYPSKGRGSKRGTDSPSPPPARQRLVSLDVFRGITVLIRKSAIAPVASHSSTGTVGAPVLGCGPRHSQ